MAREQGHNLLPSSHEGLSIQNLLVKENRRIEFLTSYDFGIRKKQLIPQWKRKLKKALNEFLAFARFYLVCFVEPIRNGERHTIWVSLRFVPHLRHRITYFHQPSCHSLPLNLPPSGPITLRWRSRIVLVVRWRLKD